MAEGKLEAPLLVEQTMRHPCIRIIGLYVKELRAIRELELPRDGLGWEGRIPDLVMIGGINGSGKTTLLEFLYEVLKFFWSWGMGDPLPQFPKNSTTSGLWVDLRIEFPSVVDEVVIRILFGGKQFADSYVTDLCMGAVFEDDGIRFGYLTEAKKHNEILNYFRFDVFKSQPSRVLYIPSGLRDLFIPEERYKATGRTSAPEELVYRWHQPRDWKDSLEARLYSARWADLNAKEEGRVEDARHFEAYSHEFERFFEGRKKLRWTTEGNLIVETNSGARHDLSQLSSGEGQIIILMSEILYRWRPGSLILIDEPELHLHSSWQTRIWEALVHWQKIQGGQVFIATQSNHLFRITEPGNAVLLGGTHLA